MKNMSSSFAPFAPIISSILACGRSTSPSTSPASAADTSYSKCSREIVCASDPDLQHLTQDDVNVQLMVLTNSSLGWATRNVFDCLIREQQRSEFGDGDPPCPDLDHQAEADRGLAAFGASGGVVLCSAEDHAKSGILSFLKSQELIETCGLERFRLTPKGRATVIQMAS